MKFGKLAINALFLIIVIVFTVAGSVMLYINQEKIEGYVSTKAVVVDYKEKTDYDVDRGYEKFYSEIVEYTVDGQKYTASNPVWTNTPKKIGKQIEIAYDPEMPSRCEFVSSNYLVPMICFSIALITLFVFVAHVITERRIRSRNQRDDVVL